MKVWILPNGETSPPPPMRLAIARMWAVVWILPSRETSPPPAPSLSTSLEVGR